MNVHKENIVVVDDDPMVLDAVVELMQDQPMNVISFTDPHDAIEKILDLDVSAVVTDIKMPGMTGIELMEEIHEHKPNIPVILMTAYADVDSAVDAVKKGAFDFIIKPYHPDYLLYAVKKAMEMVSLQRIKEDYSSYLEDLVRKRTEQLDTEKHRAEHFSRDLVERLTSIAEFRDTEAGAHVDRIGVFAGVLAEELGMSWDFVECIKSSSPMHDIGKLGITDYILFKLGELTPEEFKVIMTHTTQGERILAGSSHPVLQMAGTIALSHHERWDGSGYPQGLSGEAIPYEGRIVIIADQYDALRSERPYKNALGHDSVMEIISKGDGRTMPGHFDPEILNAFIKVSSRFDDLFHMISD